MDDSTAQHWRPFLIALAIVALVSAGFHLALREWIQAGSSGCLLLGVFAFWRSLRFHSVRWRAWAGIALVVAIALHITRFALA